MSYSMKLDLIQNSSYNPHKKTILALGTCQIAPWISGLERAGHKVDHLLWESYEETSIPDIPEKKYDVAVISLTLRNIFQRGTWCVYRDADKLMMERDAIWPKILSDGKAKLFLAACASALRSQLEMTVDLLQERPTFFFSFIAPSRNPMGDLFPKRDLKNIKYFIECLNNEIEDFCIEHKNAYYFEVNEILSEIGRIGIQDDIFYSVTHASYIHDFVVDIRHESLRLQKPTRMTSMYESNKNIEQFIDVAILRLEDSLTAIESPLDIKLIIVDLDDTMWRGVVAELPHTTWDELEGWPLGLVEALLVFKSRGGMLAICSNNDYQQTIDIFNNHFKGLLSEKDFVSIKINRDRKSENISEILSEVNISARNALFIDDNPREISDVKDKFPSIRTLSEEPYEWRMKVLYSPATQTAHISNESGMRTEMIQKKVTRDQEAKNKDRAEWLRELKLEQDHILISSDDHPDFERSFELLNKTNQFNTTGKRWTKSEIASFFSEGGEMIAWKLKDKTVNSGLIGVCLIKDCDIAQMVLSCRVFGLQSEIAALNCVCDYIASRFKTGFLPKKINITAQMIDTGRNATCHNVFTMAGFKPEQDGFLGHAAPQKPAHIKCRYSEVKKAGANKKTMYPFTPHSA